MTPARWVLAAAATLGVLLLLPERWNTIIGLVSVLVAVGCALWLAVTQPDPPAEVDEDWQRFTDGGWWR